MTHMLNEFAWTELNWNEVAMYTNNRPFQMTTVTTDFFRYFINLFSCGHIIVINKTLQSMMKTIMGNGFILHVVFLFTI